MQLSLTQPVSQWRQSHPQLVALCLILPDLVWCRLATASCLETYPSHSVMLLMQPPSTQHHSHCSMPRAVHQVEPSRLLLTVLPTVTMVTSLSWSSPILIYFDLSPTLVWLEMKMTPTSHSEPPSLMILKELMLSPSQMAKQSR